MGDLNPMYFWGGVPEVVVPEVRDVGTQTDPPPASVPKRPWLAMGSLVFSMVLLWVLP